MGGLIPAEGQSLAAPQPYLVPLSLGMHQCPYVFLFPCPPIFALYAGSWLWCLQGDHPGNDQISWSGIGAGSFLGSHSKWWKMQCQAGEGGNFPVHGFLIICCHHQISCWLRWLPGGSVRQWPTPLPSIVSGRFPGSDGKWWRKCRTGCVYITSIVNLWDWESDHFIVPPPPSPKLWDILEAGIWLPYEEKLLETASDFLISFFIIDKQSRNEQAGNANEECYSLKKHQFTAKLTIWRIPFNPQPKFRLCFLLLTLSLLLPHQGLIKLRLLTSSAIWGPFCNWKHWKVNMGPYTFHECVLLLFTAPHLL